MKAGSGNSSGADPHYIEGYTNHYANPTETNGITVIRRIDVRRNAFIKNTK
ncbi:hypothetical protein D3C73_1653770 [compost metagenome]